MGHTNSTTNYNLPQFVTTDKPAWLTDINGAFSAIDSAIHTAQSDATTAGTNASQALLDASAASTAASAADAKGAGAVASIEAAFDATAVYAVGSKVMYNSLLYRCTVAVTTPGAWTGSANWERITVDSLIPVDAAALPLGSTTPAGSTAEAIANKADVDYEYLNPTIGGNVISFWFRKIGPVCVIEVSGNSTAIPASWTVIGTLPAQFKPNTDRIVTATSIDGKLTNIWVDTNGTVRVYSPSGTYQPTGSTAYVIA